MADWTESLPAELQEEESLKSFKSVEDLAKSYLSTKQMVGGSIRIPAADAPVEEWQKIHAKLGWPEKPDGYQKLDTTKLPEGLEVDEQFMGDFYKYAHANMLTNKQANSLLQAMNERQLGALKTLNEEQAKANQEAESRLDKEFGQAKAARLEEIRRFMIQMAPATVMDKIDKADWGKDPDFLVFMNKIAQSWVDDRAIVKGRTINPMQNTPDQILNKIHELEKDPRHLNGNHPEHRKVLDEIKKLWMMMPSKQNA